MSCIFNASAIAIDRLSRFSTGLLTPNTPVRILRFVYSTRRYRNRLDSLKGQLILFLWLTCCIAFIFVYIFITCFHKLI
ncbi:hypothetical protein N7453_010877 [Penicillium expansum]|nr:hypothetical protein N7453_010877 [Penicillium expansum]